MPSDFRPIALLNAEGRLFFTLMNWRLSKYMLSNGYINTKLQKGFVEKMAGCVEHSETVQRAIADARHNKKNICVTWIDLANAYGSVRHSMVLSMLEWYWVPPEFTTIVFMYYEELSASVMVNGEQTKRFRFSRGVFQGCTLSTMLFDTAFNTVFDRVVGLTEEFGYEFTHVELTKLITGYADDIAILTKLASENQQVLEVVQEWLEWTETMKAKPKKCLATALADGRPVDPQLTIKEHRIEWIANKPFKFLGRLTQANASCTEAKRQLAELFNGHVETIDSLLLTASQKMWIFDAVLMSIISWNMMIHELPVSFATTLGETQNRMFKKWTGVSKFTTTTVFYRTPKNHGWNMKEMVPFFQKQQLIQCHLLKSSSDSDVRKLYESRLDQDRERSKSANPVVRGTWRPTIQLEECIASAVIRKRAGKANSGTQGLGMRDLEQGQNWVSEWTKNQRYESKCQLSHTQKAEQRHAALEEFSTQIEEGRFQQCLNLAAWGEWTKWDNVMEQDRDWRKLIMRTDDEIWKFEMGALEDTLPTPSVLKHWYGKKDGSSEMDATCKNCKKRACSLKHILVACEKSLEQGRYTWRHDSVLFRIYQTVRSMRDKGAQKFQSKEPIEKAKMTEFRSGGTLDNPEGEASCKVRPFEATHTLSIGGQHEQPTLPRVRTNVELTPPPLTSQARNARNNQLKVQKEDGKTATKWLAAAKRGKPEYDQLPSYHMHYAGKPPLWDLGSSPRRDKATLTPRENPRGSPQKRVYVERTKVTEKPFEQSDDWQIQFDIGAPNTINPESAELRKYAPFPAHIAASPKRPDGLMWSDKLKTVIWIELTSPWEENMTKWHFEKHGKYEKIRRAAEANGWKVVPLCVEVGARGYINPRWCDMKKAIGLSTAENRRLRYDVGKIATRCSYFLYLNRRLTEWGTTKLICEQVMPDPAGLGGVRVGEAKNPGTGQVEED